MSFTTYEADTKSFMAPIRWFSCNTAGFDSRVGKCAVQYVPLFHACYSLTETPSDNQDLSRCHALLSKGSWLDSLRRNWQPDGMAFEEKETLTMNK